jgi:hypothetical protein
MGMRNYLRVGLGALLAVSLAAPVFAQDNVSGLGSYEGADGTIFKSLTANNNYFATKYLCKDPFLTSSSIGAAIADCCVSGDIWRATIFKGNKGSAFASTANTAQFTAGAPAFAPDVYSPNATIFGAVKGVSILATMGNQTPGGLPAGATLRVTTNGGGPVCDRKQLVNGSATP